ncbi:cryptochrome/photolyase family protein [Gordonia sp. N1V]|uniref:cryptochrome/photolyase family protein n=1 Tax=Gordonia sp. N1V TaxID=3034163 RepID=UPI0023E1D0A9|nr:cryptochrome/photolyase family protein [Gordonia sp. N1V]MDF3284705.1 cryptochrome/photolyase family protein [Gordonia sp. N1V]
MSELRLVMPHQLFESHLNAEPGTRFVLVEHDLLFRQYRFHRQKLILHRVSMRRFAQRLRRHGFDVEVIETDSATTSREALGALVRRLRPSSVHLYDVVDDWLAADVRAALADAGIDLDDEATAESPNFLTSRRQIAEFFDGPTARMSEFYAWQRRRLGVLVDSAGVPVGKRWSFDAENRKPLPRGLEVPVPRFPDPDEQVDAAIEWVEKEFPDNPGDARAFRWATDHRGAREMFEDFLAERFAGFGPYEDAISTRNRYLFHGVLTPALNVGLLSPRTVLRRALEVGGQGEIGLAGLEGFVRQLIGWREYMRATYVVHGRAMRTANRLGHRRALAPGWWSARTGLTPVDGVVRHVLHCGWAHHIERLMILGNAMCLLRTHPDEVYRWFMEMFVDAYDWVMVPNVYGMSQFAAGTAITTKPYVSGSNYLRKMSDLGKGPWCAEWDGLYWTFVADHHDVLDHNRRSSVVVANLERMEPSTRAAHLRTGRRWLD